MQMDRVILIHRFYESTLEARGRKSSVGTAAPSATSACGCRTRSLTPSHLRLPIKDTKSHWSYRHHY